MKLLPLLAALFIALPAQAAVTVSEHTLQKGIFSPPKCDNNDECLCEADIRYPEISGMKDERRQEEINSGLKSSVEPLKCQGETARIASKGNNFSITHTYELTFQSPEIIGFKFMDLAYEGGAHGNNAIDGMIIDLGTGKTLAITDIFSEKNIPAINKLVYDTLIPKSEGIFHDEIENRKDSFIKDGKCQGCTIIISKDGIQVIFQAYEVAPFADGNPAVAIPAKYVSYPALTKALTAHK